MPYLVEPVVASGTMSSTPQPSLSIGEGLTLRPFRPDDAPTVLQAFKVADIQRWHGFGIDSVEEAEGWIDRANGLWAEERSAVFAAVDSSSVVLGRCALHVDLRRGTAEIAYWVLPEARGRGVAVSAAMAVTAWGHETIGVQRILLQHAVANVASCAVANRAGYTAEGTARQQLLHIDGWHDMHQHAHLASDAADPGTTTGGRSRPNE